MPRGGARVGSGRKPKDVAMAALHGSRQRTVVRFPAQPGALAQSAPEPVGAPADLKGRPLRVWLELAPFALAGLTLTAGTSAAFSMLSRAIALERKLAKGKEAGESKHRGMMQRVEAGMTRFRLAPMGKAIVQPAKVEDPFDEFDGPMLVKPA